MIDLELRHLRLVSTVARLGTLTRAGEELHLTQSALSHQLRDIEDRLGLTIFRRINKRMVITPAGERLLSTANTVQREMTSALQDLRRMADGESGTLRVSTICYTAYHWLPPLLKQFTKRFPGIDIQVVTDATHRPVEALLAGHLDLAIVYSRADSMDGRLSYHLLFEDEMVALVPSDHKLAAKEFLIPKDFAGEHLITYDVKDEELSINQEFLYPAGVTPAKHSKVALSEAIVAMVKAGLGISVMASWAIQPELRSKSLVAVPLTKKGISRQWYAVTARDSAMSEPIEEFVRLLAEKSRPARCFAA